MVDALMEEEEGEEAVALTKEQKSFAYLLLKAVIGVLDQKGMKS